MSTNKKHHPPLKAAPRVDAGTLYRPALPARPVLRFLPTAWAKLLYLRDLGPVEVGGFGVAPLDDLLLAEEFLTVRQRVTAASVCLEDGAVADFFDRQIDLGRKARQFMRLWVHSHPGDSAAPSTTDEETFARVFGRSDWAVMCILARGGQTYARLRFNVGPGGQIQVPVEVDYRRAFAGSDQAAWKQEYESNVRPEPILPGTFGLDDFGALDGDLLHARQFDLAGDIPWELHS